jgi:glycosyltransferase involved in cell wall biosynthesis
MAAVDGTSVVIPVRNGARFLADAIRSVLAQQGISELIVVDDGSEDGSATIARGFAGVTCLRRDHAGAAEARNAGVRAASGRLLAFLDADDLWVPGKLAVQRAALDRDPGLDLVLGMVASFWDEGFPEADRARLQPLPAAVAAEHVGTMLIRRESFLRVGYFDPAWRLGETVDWFLRAKELGLQGALLPEVLLRRRVHGANTGLRDRHHRGDYARIVKAALDRRRGGAAGPS